MNPLLPAQPWGLDGDGRALGVSPTRALAILQVSADLEVWTEKKGGESRVAGVWWTGILHGDLAFVCSGRRRQWILKVEPWSARHWTCFEG